MQAVGGAAAVLFWLAFGLLAYIYVGYPLIAWLRRHACPRPVLRAAIEPHVTAVVVVHDEAESIRARIENLLNSDYPRDRLQIVIGSDGSTDDTVAIAEQYVDRGVTVRNFGVRRGKPAVLNDLVPAATGEIVVLADARQRFEPAAVRALIANFADPLVGAVSGELMLEGRGGAGFYWKYEKFIRANESWSGSTVGATGAIYAIRRELFDPIPPDTILDDVLIPVRIVRRGYRVLFEADARAHDAVAATPHQEFIRKTRTIAGTFQLLAREPWLLNPLRSRIWFETLSHKVLRLAIPVLHATLFVANLALMQLGFYRWAIAGQLMFYAAALAGHLLAQTQRRNRLLGVPYTMAVLGWATIVGFARFATHRQPVTWEKSVHLATATDR